VSMTTTGSTGRSQSPPTVHLTGNDFEVFRVGAPPVAPQVNSHIPQAATTVSHRNYVNASTQTYPLNTNALVNASTQTNNIDAAVNTPLLTPKHFYLPGGVRLVAPSYVIPHPFINNNSSHTRRKLLESQGNWPQIVMHNPNGVSVPDIFTASMLSGGGYSSNTNILDSYRHFTENSHEPTGFKMRKVNGQQVISYDPSVFTQPAPTKR
jgi:hypothetical protein